MKYIQDESTNSLVFYFFLSLVIIFLLVKWDIYETNKSEKKGEYRELISKIRLRGAIIITLILLFATSKSLITRI